MCYGLKNTALKFTLYGLIFGIWAAACVFIGIGSYVAAENPTTSYPSIFDANFNNEVWEASIYMTISLGAIIAGLAVAGFCGVHRMSTFLLFVFAVSFIVVLGVEFALVIMAGTFKEDVKVSIKDTMQKQVQDDYVNENSNDKYSNDWNKMQQELKCCGSNYYSDWYVLASQFFQTEERIIPNTCCSGGGDNYEICYLEANRTNTQVEYLFTDGCAWTMFGVVEEQMTMLVTTVCITGAIQVGAVILACLLRDNIKHEFSK